MPFKACDEDLDVREGCIVGCIPLLSKVSVDVQVLDVHLLLEFLQHAVEVFDEIVLHAVDHDVDVDEKLQLSC